MTRRESAAACSLPEPDLFSYQALRIEPAVPVHRVLAHVAEPPLPAILAPIGAPLPDAPLSIALSDEAFAWFGAGEKGWEVRRRGRQFNGSEIVAGRTVTLRRGFRAEGALLGRIEQAVEASSVAQLFESVPYQEVIPVAESCDEAVAIVSRLLGPGAAAPVIGFRVAIDRKPPDIDIQAKPSKAPRPVRPRRKPGR